MRCKYIHTYIHMSFKVKKKDSMRLLSIAKEWYLWCNVSLFYLIWIFFRSFHQLLKCENWTTPDDNWLTLDDARHAQVGGAEAELELVAGAGLFVDLLAEDELVLVEEDVPPLLLVPAFFDPLLINTANSHGFLMFEAIGMPLLSSYHCNIWRHCFACFFPN